MNSNGLPSPASHISRSDYVNLVARYYIRAITEVTRVKREAQAEARAAGTGASAGSPLPEVIPLRSLPIGIPQGRIQLSVARQQQIRVLCAAFSTVLQYAPQYNVSVAEIREIIQYLDGRMSLIAGAEVDELGREEGLIAGSALQGIAFPGMGESVNGMFSLVVPNSC